MPLTKTSSITSPLEKLGRWLNYIQEHFKFRDTDFVIVFTPRAAVYYYFSTAVGLPAKQSWTKGAETQPSCPDAFLQPCGLLVKEAQSLLPDPNFILSTTKHLNMLEN